MIHSRIAHKPYHDQDQDQDQNPAGACSRAWYDDLAHAIQHGHPIPRSASGIMAAANLFVVLAHTTDPTHPDYLLLGGEDRERCKAMAAMSRRLLWSAQEGAAAEAAAIPAPDVIDVGSKALAWKSR